MVNSSPELRLEQHFIENLIEKKDSTTPLLFLFKTHIRKINLFYTKNQVNHLETILYFNSPRYEFQFQILHFVHSTNVTAGSISTSSLLNFHFLSSTARIKWRTHWHLLSSHLYFTCISHPKFSSVISLSASWSSQIQGQQLQRETYVCLSRLTRCFSPCSSEHAKRTV